MTNLQRTTAAVLFFLLWYAAPAAGAQQDFVLVNETGVTIQELYISPVKTDKWQEDVFGDAVLPDGNEVVVTFPVDESHCRWDLKIVDSDEDEVVWNNLNLCKVKTITLYWVEGKATADLE